MESGFVFLAMWLVPPALFVLTGMFMVYREGCSASLTDVYVHFDIDKYIDKTNLLCLLGILYPLAMLMYYHFVVGGAVTIAGIFGYTIFELAGSWLIYGLFTITGIHGWYGIKERHLKQKYSMNVDFDDLDVGQYVVRTRKNHDYQKPYRLELKQVHIEKDVTGEYKVLNNIESWGNTQFWTEQEIKDTLSDFFKARNLFYIDNENGFGIIQVEQHKPKIIVIE